ncbi:MAG TPA: T9SS type A sorting domain-containing protein [Flavobacterium sp.]|nr:T9SS type A sorting domain-containing protein [Flavobacterium sp.]
MKKIYFILVLLLSFAANTFSQEYHPLLNNSSWVVADWVSCCRPPKVKIIPEGTDTIIGAYTYKKFKDPFPQYDSNNNRIYDVFLREDIAAKKVYKIIEGVDFLLYDYGMETGDVISQYGNTFTATVDYITVNDGTERKRITLLSSETYCSSHYKQIWIEGIGSNKHPFYPQHNMGNVCSSGGGLTIFTRCSFQNGAHLYGAEDCPTTFETLLGVEEAEASNVQINFSPNPFTTELTIQSDIAFREATIRIYNIKGKLVRESRNQSGNQLKISRGDLQSGLYLIELSEKGKMIKTAKIMAE